MALRIRQYGVENAIGSKIQFLLCSTTPWDGRITVGVLNVTDEDPELDSFASPRPAVYSLYSLDGRIPYVSYRHFF